MVRSLLRLPGIRSLHERKLLFPVVVVVVVGAVLAQGALERAAQAERETPADIIADTVAPPAPTPVRPALRGGLEKTPLTYFADYWAQLAAEVETHLVAVGPARAGGVVLETGLAVTTVAGADAVAAEAARMRLAHDATGTDDAAHDVEPRRPAVRAVDRETGLAVVDIDPAAEPFETARATDLTSGSYIGAVSRRRPGPASITPGYLVSVAPPATNAAGTSDLDISVAPPRLGVAAVVDLDGALLGVTYMAPDGPRALSLSALRRVIDRMAQVGPCRAITVAEPGDAVRALLDIDGGVVISDVVVDAFLPEPSLRPGDVVLEWGGEPVASVDSFNAGYDAAPVGSVVRYRVIRGRRRVSGGTVLPDAECRAGPPPVARLVAVGMALRWVDGDPGRAGWMVETVAPGGRAEVAGIEEGDRLLAVDGRRLDRRDQLPVLERVNTREASALLTVRRSGGVRLLAVAAP